MTGRSSPACNRPPRVFIGLSEIAGHYSSLEVGLRRIGVDARFHNLSPNVLSYGRARPRSYQRLLSLRHAAPGSLRFRLWTGLLRANRAMRRVRAALLFPWAVAKYDMFVLGGQETFLGGSDLWILRRLRKPVVIIFTGSDHRPPYLSGRSIRELRDSRSLAAETRRLRRRVAIAERWASAIVALPASAQLHRRHIVDFLKVGVPFDAPVAKSPAPTTPGDSSEIRILHCPTDPIAKGSDAIRRVVSRSRAEGLNVSFREITGRPNVEVLEALQSCDFVIDEAYSDTPMAKFATEAAYYGKPAVVGSYAVAMYQANSNDALPPTLVCHPDQLDEAVRSLASDRALRTDLGSRAKRFVTEQWAPDVVAHRLMAVLNGSIPSEWMVDPTTVSYVHGWGVSEATLRNTLRQMIDELGVQSLQLPANSRARELAVELARGASPPEGAGPTTVLE